jgi:hypothetical protein
MDYFSFSDTVVELYSRSRRSLLGIRNALDEAEKLLNSIPDFNPENERIYYELFYRYFEYTAVMVGDKYYFELMAREKPLEKVNLGFMVMNDIYMYSSTPGDDDPVMVLPEGICDNFSQTSSLTARGAVIHIDDFDRFVSSG